MCVCVGRCRTLRVKLYGTADVAADAAAAAAAYAAADGLMMMLVQVFVCACVCVVMGCVKQPHSTWNDIIRYAQS